jgi:hypothetical protein
MELPLLAENKHRERITKVSKGNLLKLRGHLFSKEFFWEDYKRHRHSTGAYILPGMEPSRVEHPRYLALEGS